MGRKSIAVSEETHERLARLAKETGRTIGGTMDLLSRRAESDDGELRLFPDRFVVAAMRLLNDLVTPGIGYDRDGIDPDFLEKAERLVAEMQERGEVNEHS